jgi:hypothetical protein
MANILERLTEGTVAYDKKRETAALVSKWEKSGLLEGIGDDFKRGAMALMLENQAKELLREANAMSAGDVQGFASVAFPIVRRVFAGLIANDLVSVQPMSLPSGLVFFMDFKHGTNTGFANDKVRSDTESIYGDRVGQEIRNGVRVNGNDFADKGYYSLNSGYGTARYAVTASAAAFEVVGASILPSQVGESGSVVRFDPDLASEPDTKKIVTFRIPLATIDPAGLIAEQDLASLSIVSGTVSAFAQGPGTGYASVALQAATPGTALPKELKLVRRLTKVVQGEGKLGASVDALGTKYVQVSFLHTGSIGYTLGMSLEDGDNSLGTIALQYPIKDQIVGQTGQDMGLGALKGGSPWSLEAATELPEIQLKVDSFSITARSRKLKAAWTPELGQDLNAYHNLDAEVELTSILSEQIGLEIDQEILNDLIKGQTGGVKYWSRRPGNFVNRLTGEAFATTADNAVLPPDFTGNVSMWYETLLETINDVSADIHRKTLRGGANFIVVSPEVANILEFTAGFRATVTHDSDKGTTGAVKVGALNSKFDVIVDPYFPRNVILVGRKGSSFLESGYVYSPYVPLQTTPTIFDPKDFTPRKAVMTRYGKAFVRPDMFGLVIVKDLLG